MIEIIIRILLGLLMFLGVSEQAAPPPTSEPTFHSPTIIDNVQGVVLTSFPAQIVLQIDGSQPDGCEYPVIVEQTREGNTVTVEIYRDMPVAAACPMMVVPYNDSIKLDGVFEPGTYTIHVNNYTLEVTV
jgi:hypothetical protein